MNFFSIFDYIYYRIFRFYKLRLKDDIPGVYASVMLTFILSVNVITILYLVKKIGWLNYVEIKDYLIHVFMSLLLLIFIRFNFITYQVLDAKWNNEDENDSKRKGWFVVMYMLGSLFGGISLVNLIG